MVNFLKKHSILSYGLVVAAVLTIVSFIMYLVNASTGAGSVSVNAWVVVCFIGALILECGLWGFSDKLPKYCTSIGLLVVGALLTIVIYMWIMMAVPWAENVWFLSSVLEPDPTEVSSLNSALTGVIFVGITYVFLIVGAIPPSIVKEEETPKE